LRDGTAPAAMCSPSFVLKTAGSFAPQSGQVIETQGM
jgi:hypothetical protein